MGLSPCKGCLRNERHTMTMFTLFLLLLFSISRTLGRNHTFSTTCYDVNCGWYWRTHAVKSPCQSPPHELFPSLPLTYIPGYHMDWHRSRYHLRNTPNSNSNSCLPPAVPRRCMRLLRAGGAYRNRRTIHIRNPDHVRGHPYRAWGRKPDAWLRDKSRVLPEAAILHHRPVLDKPVGRQVLISHVL